MFFPVNTTGLQTFYMCTLVLSYLLGQHIMHLNYVPSSFRYIVSMWVKFTYLKCLHLFLLSMLINIKKSVSIDFMLANFVCKRATVHLATVPFPVRGLSYKAITHWTMVGWLAFSSQVEIALIQSWSHEWELCMIV